MTAMVRPRYRFRETSVILMLMLAALAAPAFALDYPTRPVKAIVAVGAGGTGDIFMRVLGEELYRLWGQPVVVENRPGGASNIGARACAEAPPDGYTICILPGEPLAYNQFLFKKLAFDPARDFAPIVNPFFNIQALVVNSSQGGGSKDTWVLAE